MLKEGEKCDDSLSAAKLAAAFLCDGEGISEVLRKSEQLYVHYIFIQNTKTPPMLLTQITSA